MSPHVIPLAAVKRHLRWEALWQRYRFLQSRSGQVSMDRQQLVDEAFELGTETYKSAMEQGMLKPFSQPRKEVSYA